MNKASWFNSRIILLCVLIISAVGTGYWQYQEIGYSDRVIHRLMQEIDQGYRRYNQMDELLGQQQLLQDSLRVLQNSLDEGHIRQELSDIDIKESEISALSEIYQREFYNFREAEIVLTGSWPSVLGQIVSVNAAVSTRPLIIIPRLEVTRQNEAGNVQARMILVFVEVSNA